MTLLKQIKAMLEVQTTECWKEFWAEIKTDENADYRRGFKAGILLANLHLKAEIMYLSDDFTLTPANLDSLTTK
jgi:hypothetical protein